jgi:hypothetical protein
MIHLTFRTKLLASHVAVVAAVVLMALFVLDRSLGADLAADLDRRLELQAVPLSGIEATVDRVDGRIGGRRERGRAGVSLHDRFARRARRVRLP